MNRTEYLLVKLMEECNEVSQRAAKALCFTLEEKEAGQDLTNAERIVYEFNDFMAIMSILADEGVFKKEALIDIKMIDKKKEKLKKWMEYSKEIGTLKP